MEKQAEAGTRTGLVSMGGGQEAAGKKLHVREYHRSKNTETVISQQTPLLLLHATWTKGLREGSNWIFIQHIQISMVI